MANYHEYALLEATDPDGVGLGFGDTGSGIYSDKPEGEKRICICLGAKKIEWPVVLHRPEQFVELARRLVAQTDPVSVPDWRLALWGSQ